MVKSYLFYDLVSTMVFPGLSKRLAMKIGRAKEIDSICNKDWILLADSVKFKPDLILRLKNEMIDLVLRESKELKKEFSNITIIEDIYRLIKKNILRLAAKS